MPQKTLRSMINEFFPFELRVELDLLSRRRDIFNNEKQEEIFNLLRKYEIKDVTPLGPGTNRYAFKLNGFVIKVATDSDGKIDNLKEFKMAKRLFPYVTKTYEVAKNGTLLVAEYIQPFQSYSEMLKYAEEIRNILTKLSSVYLIGDVGIDSKNYANWGLRVGSDEPVCLDFAYVYEVSSTFFLCSKCNTQSMLMPNKDFTGLYCSSPVCGAKYSFEDIRRRIGNDLHRLEIGDLSTEGYIMTKPSEMVELTPERSNYLEKAKDAKKDQKKTEEIEPDDFELEYSPDFYNNFQGGSTMNNEQAVREFSRMMTSTSPITIKAKAVVASTETEEEIVCSGKVPDEKPVIKGVAVLTSEVETPAEEENSNILPEADDEEKVSEGTGEPMEGIEATIGEEAVLDTTTEEVGDAQEEDPASNFIDTVATSFAESSTEANEEEMSDELRNFMNGNYSAFDPAFIQNMSKYISNVSNIIGSWLEARSIFDAAQPYLNVEFAPKEFYRTVQNAVFRSICIFCQLNQSEYVGEKDKIKKSWSAPGEDVLYDVKYVSTFQFINDFSNAMGSLNHYNVIEHVNGYRESRPVGGISLDWIEVFKERLKSKMDIQEDGISIIANEIKKVFCCNVTTLEEEGITDETINEFLGNNEPEEINAEESNDTEEHAETSEEAANESDEGQVISGAVPEDDEYEYYESDDESAKDGIIVEIMDEDGLKLIRVHHSDAYGQCCIPIYNYPTKQNENRRRFRISEKNGIWDWLTSFAPDMMFETEKSDFWLNANSQEDANCKIVILQENGNKDLMGIYSITGIYEIDEERNINVMDDEAYVSMINEVIQENIGGTRISHYERTMSMKDNPGMIHSEEEIENSYSDDDEYYYDEAEESSGEETSNDELEEAAIAAIKEGMPADEEELTTFKPIRRPKT